MSEADFPEGLWFNQPHEKAPSFVKGSISVDLKKFSRWAEAHLDDKGRVRIKLLEAKSGKYYAALDTFKPEDKKPAKQKLERPPEYDDEIPF